jgi:hypothetical protein
MRERFMKTTVTKALNSYFNEGAGKRSAGDFLKELKALTTEEKRELAEGVVAITGDTLE